MANGRRRPGWSPNASVNSYRSAPFLSAGGKLVPVGAGAAFRRLPLSQEEFRVIKTNHSVLHALTFLSAAHSIFSSHHAVARC